MADVDHYRTLQVDPAADPEVIEAAYRRLSRKYHPDVNRSPDAADRMKDLNAAYEVLGEARRRASYDRSRRGFGTAATWERSAQPPPVDEPRLVLTSRALRLANVRVATTSSTDFSVHNGGGGSLRGRVTSSVPWLEISPVVFVANRTRIRITCHARELSPGCHEARLNVESNGGNATISVTAEVVPAMPRVSVSPRSLKLTSQAASPVEGTILISAPTGQRFSGQARADRPWLAVSPASFSGVTVPLTVSVIPTLVPTGERHRGNVRLQVGEQTVRISIDLVALTSPTVVVEPALIDFGTMHRGEVVHRTIRIRNRGGGTLSGQILTRGDWLRVSRTQIDSNDLDVTLTADPSALHGFWDCLYLDAHAVDGKIEIQTTGGTITVPVSALLSRAPRPPLSWIRTILERGGQPLHSG